MQFSSVLLLIASPGCTDETGKDDKTRPGLERTQCGFHGAQYDVVRANLELIKCRFYWKDESGKSFETIDALRDWLRARGAAPEFIANGGIYEPGLVPAGLYIENGATLVPLNNHDGTGNFYLKPNGVLTIEGTTVSIVDAAEYDAGAFPPDFAIQSGPLLLKNGDIHPAFNPDSENHYIRSGVGMDSDGQVVFVLSKEPVTFHEFATLFRDELACENALYLDGAISAFAFGGDADTPQSTPYASMIVLEPRKD